LLKHIGLGWVHLLIGLPVFAVVWLFAQVLGFVVHPIPKPILADPNLRRRVWIELADLHFLDQRATDEEIDRTARFLSDHGISRELASKILIMEVAPAVAGNLGYFLFPIVAGEWGTFGEDWLEASILTMLANPYRLLLKSSIIGEILYWLFFANIVGMAGWHKLASRLSSQKD